MPTMCHIVCGVQILFVILIEKVLSPTSNNLQWNVRIVQLLRWTIYYTHKKMYYKYHEGKTY